MPRSAQVLERLLEVGVPVTPRSRPSAVPVYRTDFKTKMTHLALRYQSHLASELSQAMTPVPSSFSPRCVAISFPLPLRDCQTDVLGRATTSPLNQVMGSL